MSKSNIHNTEFNKGRKNSVFPYLVHPEPDEVKRFWKIHIDNRGSARSY